MSDYEEKAGIDSSPAGPNEKALVDRWSVEQTGRPRIWKQIAPNRWTLDLAAERERDQKEQERYDSRGGSNAATRSAASR